MILVCFSLGPGRLLGKIIDQRKRNLEKVRNCILVPELMPELFDPNSKAERALSLHATYLEILSLRRGPSP